MKEIKKNFSLIQRGLNAIAFALDTGSETKGGIKVDLNYLCETTGINIFPTNEPNKLVDPITKKQESAGLELITRYEEGIVSEEVATIYYKKGEIDNETRSNIAHEIAHYLIHKDKISITEIYLEKIGNSQILTEVKRVAKSTNRELLPEEQNVMEAEADTLASFILIPYKYLKKVYETANFNIPYLVKMFGVSDEIARERIEYFESSDDFRANIFSNDKYKTPPEEFFK